MSEDGAPPTGRSSKISELYDELVAVNTYWAALDDRLAHLAEDTDEWAQAWLELEAASKRTSDLVASLADHPATSTLDLVLKAKALVMALTSADGGSIDVTDGHLRLARAVASDVVRLL